MFLIQIADRFLGAILQTALCFGLIVLAAITISLRFVDLFMQSEIVDGVTMALLAPLIGFTALVIGLTNAIYMGWQKGLYAILIEAPLRIKHFFSTELLFGLQKNESIHVLFKTSTHSEGFDILTGTGFFGRVAIKVLSLFILPMEVFIAHKARSAYAHSAVNIFFNIRIIKNLETKFIKIVNKENANILKNIYSYLSSEKTRVESLQSSLQNDNSPGILQSLQDQLQQIEASIRCVKRLAENEDQIDPETHNYPRNILYLVWTAIEKESKDLQAQKGLREKLISSLYLIQRGYNIALDNTSSHDLPECPTAAIGLLLRVLTDEKDRLLHSEYVASDPNPANLSQSLKTMLDAPFLSTHGLVTSNKELDFYQMDPFFYKAKRKENILSMWKSNFSDLMESKSSHQPAITEETLKEIVEAGVEAWEPPTLPRR